jgi:protein TonB
VEVSARERYLYELRVLIEGRRTYPSVSRRLGESGEVRVGFELHRDGSIRDVAITAPSPHPRLNEAALALVQGLGAYRPFVAEIRADKIHVEIPVAYRLN